MTALIEIEHEARQRNKWSLRMHGPTFSLGGLFWSLVQFPLPTFTISWRLKEDLLLDAMDIIDS